MTETSVQHFEFTESTCQISVFVKTFLGFFHERNSKTRKSLPNFHSNQREWRISLSSLRKNHEQHRLLNITNWTSPVTSFTLTFYLNKSVAVHVHKLHFLLLLQHPCSTVIAHKGTPAYTLGIIAFDYFRLYLFHNFYFEGEPSTFLIFVALSRVLPWLG